MKLKIVAAFLLVALIAWMLCPPIKTAASQQTKTKPPEDLITQDLVIKDNAIQATPVQTNSVQQSPTQGLSNRRYSSAANGDIQILAREKVIARWSEAEWSAFHYILDHESGTNPFAVNPSSGACGIPQALPCSKLLNVIGSLDNIPGQLDWMINYIAARYGTPTQAMYFWQTHHWY